MHLNFTKSFDDLTLKIETTTLSYDHQAVFTCNEIELITNFPTDIKLYWNM